MSEESGRHNALDRLAGLVPVDAVVRNVDVQAVIDRIDLDAVLSRVDLDAVLSRVDVDALVARIDLDQVIARMDLARLMEQSVRGAASGSLDVVRAQSVRLDSWLTVRIDQLLRRKPGWRPSRPTAAATTGQSS